MVETIEGRWSKAADDWLGLWGKDLRPSDDARSLLAARLAIRRRTLLRCWPFWALGVLALGVSVLASLNHLETAIEPQYAFGTVTAVGLVGLSAIVASSWVSRAEARLAASLEVRVSRPEHLKLRVVLGRTGVRCALLAIAAQVTGAAVVAFAAGPGWLVPAYVLALVGQWALVAYRMWQVVRLPTVAVDSVSLAIDERLRTQDARNSLILLLLQMTAFLSVSSLLGPADVVWFVAYVVTQVTQISLLLASLRPWNGRSGRP